ncbi:MAG: DUF3179 domain-containing (seleno)protein [bacterium]|nr:DUF3179 domain-containing (seleno)protein [bacterium]
MIHGVFREGQEQADVPKLERLQTLGHRGSHPGAGIRLLVVALALILASCGGETTAEPPEEPAAAPTTSPLAATSTSAPAAETTSTAASPTETITTTPAVTTTSRAESAADTIPAEEVDAVSMVSSEGYTFPPPPDFPDGGISVQLRHDLNAFFDIVESERRFAHMELLSFTNHDDIRVAWVLADILRFANSLELIEVIGARLRQMLGEEGIAGDPIDLWKRVTNLLIAWDLPAFPDYPKFKKRLFVLVEPGWEPFFNDPDATIDWRWVSWGGVFIDNRPLGAGVPCPRGCIPSLDDPAVTPASEGDWYPDDRVVFGVTINGESRAYPKHQMEIHEMVNDTLGGRRIGMPYCTLCGSAQAYFTDGVPEGIEVPVLRTSGLLSRSNKVMYDLNTSSVFDTFTGEAVSGPLREAGIRLDQATVVSSTWGAWKEAHPDTTILAEDGGLGRSYPFDPLRGRDDQGPIFPVGDVDTRLGVQDLVVGVELEDGRTVAFSREAALAVIDSGGEVTAEGVRLIKDGDGLRAISVSDGSEIPSHQAFWFAWSQFRPNTRLWSSPG